MDQGFDTDQFAPRALADRRACEPGVVVIFAAGVPVCHPYALQEPIVLGRAGGSGAIKIDDRRLSRVHTRISLHGGAVRIEDLRSRNGTFVDGERAGERSCARLPRIVRAGQSLLLVVADVVPFFEHQVLVKDGRIAGPALQRAQTRIAAAARGGDALLIRGPSGSGKEAAAAIFHAATGRASGPFVPVNCAAIPHGLAERLLFGAKRGAFSGASEDSDGYVQAAHRGTLFLDEVAELEPGVQAKLLRVLETRDVLPLGALKHRQVDIRVCAATHKDLRAEVVAGRFREDLYYRIGRPEERVPPIVERIEEIPWHLAHEVAQVDRGLRLSAELVEACALRAWPGNVRELRTEARHAARVALSEGAAVVEGGHLSPTAGERLEAPGRPPGAPRSIEESDVVAALERHGGNVTRAAAELGLHRTQLRRWLARRRAGKTEDAAAAAASWPAATGEME